jgi:hypothetical protein
MKRIVLISCVASKGKTKSKASELYKGPLFRNSLEYARALKPNKIFVLSALHHLLDLNKEIEPYNVTLSNIPASKRLNNPDLKVLSKAEAREWGQRVLRQLRKVADLEKDKFIILAGQSYIHPIEKGLVHIEQPLAGLRQGERIQLLIKKLKELNSSDFF